LSSAKSKNIKPAYLIVFRVGKSTFIEKLITHRDHLFREPFARILYCYPAHERSIYVESKINELRKQFDMLEVNYLN
jgi:aminopeptidase N